MIKRKGLIKKERKNNLLFDFLNDITFEKKNIINSENSHLYSKYMITRFLSMYESYLPLCSIYLNKYQAVLTNEEFHKLCLSVIPKRKIFLQYIKGIPLKNQCKEQVEYISNYFQVSEDEAFDYYKIAGDTLVNNIKKLYGVLDS